MPRRLPVPVWVLPWRGGGYGDAIARGFCDHRSAQASVFDCNARTLLLDGASRKLMRSILDVVQAQSRQIQDANFQFESARIALAERKTIDRAKGVLMSSRGLSEENAYKLMRKVAMNQNKRIVDGAEAILSTADISRGLNSVNDPSC